MPISFFWFLAEANEVFRQHCACNVLLVAVFFVFLLLLCPIFCGASGCTFGVARNWPAASLVDRHSGDYGRGHHVHTGNWFHARLHRRHCCVCAQRQIRQGKNRRHIPQGLARPLDLRLCFFVTFTNLLIGYFQVSKPLEVLRRVLDPGRVDQHAVSDDPSSPVWVR